MWHRACAVVALLCAALALADNFKTLKRAEMSASPFVLSSRYGRSSPRAMSPRAMSPRNDRFFLTGRYGKRSAARDSLGVALARALLGPASDRDAVRAGTAPDRDSCVCPPYARPAPLARYYKRLPEVADAYSERH